jgi:glycosyltransferase involved in cell wall biosynthesis
VIRIKILWFSHRDIKHSKAGGVEKAIFEVSRRLVVKGHEVSWHSVRENGEIPEEVDSGVMMKRYRGNLLVHFSVPLVLKREKPDIVVDDLGHVVPWGTELFKIKGIASFAHLHRRSLRGQVSLPSRFILSGLEATYPLIYRKFPFVSISQSSKKDLTTLGIHRDRIRVISLGLNSSDFLNFEKSVHPSLVYFGGLKDYKRPWDAVYLMKEVLKKYPNARLSVIGSGPSIERVKRTIESENLSDNIELTGRLPEKQLKKIVGTSWVNIHTSATEGFGLSILEASALGTPTVAYSVPGVSDAIVNGKNGLLVPDGNLKMLTDAAFQLLGSSTENFRSSSMEVARGYSWDKTAELWELLLKDICSAE